MSSPKAERWRRSCGSKLVPRSARYAVHPFYPGGPLFHQIMRVAHADPPMTLPSPETASRNVLVQHKPHSGGHARTRVASISQETCTIIDLLHPKITPLPAGFRHGPGFSAIGACARGYVLPKKGLRLVGDGSPVPASHCRAARQWTGRVALVCVPLSRRATVGTADGLSITHEPQAVFDRTQPQGKSTFPKRPSRPVPELGRQW